MSLSHEGSKCSKQALTDSQTTLSCPFSSFNHQPDKVPSFQMTDRTQGPLRLDSAHLGPFNISRPFTSGSPTPSRRSAPPSLRTTRPKGRPTTAHGLCSRKVVSCREGAGRTCHGQSVGPLRRGRRGDEAWGSGKTRSKKNTIKG